MMTLFPEPNKIPEISGLDYISDYLSLQQSKDLLKQIDNKAWNTDLKRRVQHYGYKYNYKKQNIDISMKAESIPDFLRVFENFDQVIVNEYLPGQGISAHIDCIPCFAEDIWVISLGWEYEIEFIKDYKIDTLKLGIGSLLKMSGDARYKWKHCIKAKMKDGNIQRQRRVSVTYRKVLI